MNSTILIELLGLKIYIIVVAIHMRAYRSLHDSHLAECYYCAIGAVHDTVLVKMNKLKPFIQVLSLDIAFGIGSTTVRYIERNGPKRFLFDALSMLLLVYFLVVQLGWVDVHKFMEHKARLQPGCHPGIYS
ncbi:MAG: hypothetical protein R2784_12355 [Saprospiraceae bacterium]